MESSDRKVVETLFSAVRINDFLLIFLHVQKKERKECFKGISDFLLIFLHAKKKKCFKDITLSILRTAMPSQIPLARTPITMWNRTG